MKQVTKKDVLNIANVLIKSKKTTSSIEVKSELRELGYITVQDDIDLHLMDIAMEQNWSSVFNGTFYEYSTDPSFLNHKAVYKCEDTCNCKSDEDSFGFIDWNIKNETSDERRDVYGYIDPNNIKKLLEKSKNETLNGKKVDVKVVSTKVKVEPLNTKLASHRLRTGRVVIPYKESEAPKGSWKVTSPATPHTLYFSGDLTRDEARHSFYKICNLQRGTSFSAIKI